MTTYGIGNGGDGTWWIVADDDRIKGPYHSKRAARYALAEIEAGEDPTNTGDGDGPERPQ